MAGPAANTFGYSFPVKPQPDSPALRVKTRDHSALGITEQGTLTLLSRREFVSKGAVGGHSSTPPPLTPAHITSIPQYHIPQIPARYHTSS